MSTLFDDDLEPPREDERGYACFGRVPSPDATVTEPPADVALAGVVTCAGHGGSILRKVAVAIRVDPNRVSEGHCAYSCRQAACVARVAQDLAAKGCELL